MKTICFSTIVNAKYQNYIPLFWYSLHKSYPDYSSLIFMKGNLSKNTKRAVKIMQEKGDYQIRENCFTEFRENEQYFKTIRWILTDDYFTNYKYLYIGDVDMIICKEPISLVDQHSADASNQGLPYSNFVRGGQERLIGRHFVITKPYFDAMSPVIKKYTTLLRDGLIDPKSNDEGKGNEWVLYRMVKEAGLGFPKPIQKQQRGIFSTHHGLHLGLWRTKPRPPSNDLSKDLHLSFWKQFLNMSEDKLYKSIIELSPVHDIKNMKKAYRKFLDEQR